MNTEFARLVGCGSDYATAAAPANDHRLALQFGIQSLFDGRVKSVHVDMQIPGHHCVAKAKYPIVLIETQLGKWNVRINVLAREYIPANPLRPRRTPRAG